MESITSHIFRSSLVVVLNRRNGSSDGSLFYPLVNHCYRGCYLSKVVVSTSPVWSPGRSKKNAQNRKQPFDTFSFFHNFSNLLESFLYFLPFSSFFPQANQLLANSVNISTTIGKFFQQLSDFFFLQVSKL